MRVLIGEDQTALVKLLSSFVEAAAAEKCHVDIVSSPPHAEEILGRCGRIRCDLVILILNNIIFPDVGIRTRETRAERWLRFITEIKSLHNCRIIVMCGWMKDDPVLDTLHVTDAIAAGASFFFRLPSAAREIIGAIGECLFSREPEAAPPHQLEWE